MKCKSCGSDKLEVVTSGPHNKLVCTECLSFVTFLSKAKAKVFKQLAKKKQEEGSKNEMDGQRRLHRGNGDYRFMDSYAYSLRPFDLLVLN